MCTQNLRSCRFRASDGSLPPEVSLLRVRSSKSKLRPIKSSLNHPKRRLKQRTRHLPRYVARSDHICDVLSAQDFPFSPLRTAPHMTTLTTPMSTKWKKPGERHTAQNIDETPRPPPPQSLHKTQQPDSVMHGTVKKSVQESRRTAHPTTPGMMNGHQTDNVPQTEIQCTKSDEAVICGSEQPQLHVSFDTGCKNEDKAAHKSQRSHLMKAKNKKSECQIVSHAHFVELFVKQVRLTRRS